MTGQMFHNSFFNTVMNRGSDHKVLSYGMHNITADSKTSLDSDWPGIPPLDLGQPLVPINEKPSFSRRRILPMSIDSLINHKNTELILPTHGDYATLHHDGSHVRESIEHDQSRIQFTGIEQLRSHGQLYDKTPSSNCLRDRLYNQPTCHLVKGEPSEEVLKETNHASPSPPSRPIKRERDQDDNSKSASPPLAKRPCLEGSPPGFSNPVSPKQECYSPPPDLNKTRFAESLMNHQGLRLLGSALDIVHSQMGFTKPMDDEEEKWQNGIYHSSSRILSNIALESLGDARDDMLEAMI
ncbi:hypothetical protein ACHAQH_008141 [Verticillium albo-atrum]